MMPLTPLALRHAIDERCRQPLLMLPRYFFMRHDVIAALPFADYCFIYD